MAISLRRVERCPPKLPAGGSHPNWAIETAPKSGHYYLSMISNDRDMIGLNVKYSFTKLNVECLQIPGSVRTEGRNAESPLHWLGPESWARRFTGLQCPMQEQGKALLVGPFDIFDG